MQSDIDNLTIFVLRIGFECGNALGFGLRLSMYLKQC